MALCANENTPVSECEGGVYRLVQRIGSLDPIFGARLDHRRIAVGVREKNSLAESYRRRKIVPRFSRARPFIHRLTRHRLQACEQSVIVRYIKIVSIQDRR